MEEQAVRHIHFRVLEATLALSHFPKFLLCIINHKREDPKSDAAGMFW
jgi:hypothetical protein